MSSSVHVIGFGDLGREVIAQCLSANTEVVLLQRRKPANLPAGVEFRPVDVLDAEALTQAVRDAQKVVCAVGFPYRAKVWEAAWPLATSNLVVACEQANARLVMAGNLYGYGPHDGVLDESFPLTQMGGKPGARAAATKIWMQAAEMGRLEVAAVSAPDFYGPNVLTSALGAPSLKALAAGKAATFLGGADHLHDVVHIRDFARAILTVLDADSADFGQNWHVPSAPTKTFRQLVSLAATALQTEPRVKVMPLWSMRLLSPMVPILRESLEMRFTFDRPYRVSGEKYLSKFGHQPTPLETGIPEAALSYRPAVAPSVNSEQSRPDKTLHAN